MITTVMASAVVLAVVGEGAVQAAPAGDSGNAAAVQQAHADEYTHIVIDKRPRGQVDLDELRASLDRNGLQTTKNRWRAEGRNVTAELKNLPSGYVDNVHHEHVFMWDSSKKGIEGANALEDREAFYRGKGIGQADAAATERHAVRVKVRWDALKKDGRILGGTLKGDGRGGPLGGASTNGAWAYKGDIPRKYLFIEGVDDPAHPGMSQWLAGKGWPEGSGVCQAGAASGRAKRSAPAALCSEDVARTQRERLRAHGDDVEYVTSLEEFEKNPKSLLSPLRETNKALNDAKGAELGAQDFEKFSARVGEAFGRDLRAAHELTTDTGLLARVGRQAGRAAGLGVKALPYVGIAATGYAITEDVKTGDYANLAFDSVAEGLQVAMVAQPEFAPLLEPALLVEQLAQLVYNEVAGWIAEQKQLDHDRAQWGDAVKDLVEHRDAQWGARLQGQALQELFPRLNEKFKRVLTSDVVTLGKWAKAKKAAVARIAERSRARAASPEEKQRISAHESALKKKIDAQVWEQQDARTELYGDQVVKVAAGAFAAVIEPGKDGKSGFDTFNDQFVEKSVKPYLDKLIDRISDDEFRASGAREWNQRELTRRQERWRKMKDDKLAEVRKALSATGRTTLSEADLRKTQKKYFPAKEAFRDPERDRERTFAELVRDQGNR
ncbi:hypothetical protein I5Q34_30325 [Streptomyces sp. AV19]|uniref:hypothetical protein n=1 Tax=Streptomyces sp. AV19 TaxID=2793068 RepID=UPI0018FE1CDE|nr:hypothetical protein [Streptomyces sp. AV19]MBH1938505.1 hypothetical protein [Streptomyces sp. AV19]MDG4535154.1 hypothetical protein [Streptomyces sp. AV19]